MRSYPPQWSGVRRWNKLPIAVEMVKVEFPWKKMVDPLPSSAASTNKDSVVKELTNVSPPLEVLEEMIFSTSCPKKLAV